MAKNSVTVIDKGARKLVASLQEKAASALLVGVQGTKAAEKHKPSEHEKDTAPAEEPLTVGEIAEIHEFGLGVPRRSWLRDWFEEHKQEIEEDLRKITRGVLLGKITKERGLEILGVKYQGQIQKRISDGEIEPPLAQRTIDAKGSSTPLIDTGQLRSAISWKLEKLAQKIK